jgi:hypothetical protein
LSTLYFWFSLFKKAGDKHKRIDNAVNAILKNNFIETRKDKGNFKKQVLICCVID